MKTKTGTSSWRYVGHSHGWVHLARRHLNKWVTRITQHQDRTGPALVVVASQRRRRHR